MVALLHHQPGVARSPQADPGRLRLVPDGRVSEIGLRAADRSVSGDGSVRPHLELVPGVDAPDRPSLGVIVAVAMVVFGLFGGIRLLQGSFAAAPEPEAGSVAVAVPAPGDRVVVARPGDTLWSIATELSPERDSRPVVAALIEANGGDAIQIGQQIVIPSDLLD